MMIKKSKRDTTPRFQIGDQSQDKMKVSRSNVVSSHKKDSSEHYYFSRDMRHSQNLIPTSEAPIMLNAEQERIIIT